MPSQPLRIVSLLPGATEIVYALGLGDSLVGRSHECDFPPQVQTLPVCCEPTIDPATTSREINSEVEGKLTDALSIFRVDIDRIRELQPTHILTQAQCEVCAVSLSDVESALAVMTDNSPAVVSLSPACLDDLWRGIAHTADAFECVDAGKSLVDSLQTRLQQVSHKTRDAEPQPKVACIEWLDPLMSAGNWIPELVAAAGGKNLLGTTGEHSPWMDYEQLIHADPDVILVFPCGFTIERTVSEFSAVTGNAAWNDLRAVEAGEIYVIDGHHYLNRPGPRLVDSAEIIAEILHPDRVAVEHEGIAWIRMPAISSP